MARVLLINPSYLRAYGVNQAGIANPVYPILSLATLAGSARADGHTPRILDLSYRPYDPDLIRSELRSFKPDVVAVTATTPLVNQMRDISYIAKEVSTAIVTVGGGAHPSSLPRETMLESKLDMVAVGEGDATIKDILGGRKPREILGIYRREGEEVVANPPRPLIPYLDALPMPAWDLYPIDVYASKVTKIIAKYPPITTVEFSRGCVFLCDFCGSKNTMGLGYRKKSPQRCAEELAHLQELGYGEALLTDDIFTSDNAWAVEVCESIAKKGLKIMWTCTNGIRVDSADERLFRAMRAANCYRVHFGFESGNDRVLKAFGKGGKATLDQGRKAVRLANEAGLETWGMFMVGLSADDESTMQDTIDYAKSVEVDVKKLGITVPFPGTPMFADLLAKGKLKTFDWDDYNVYNEATQIYDHPTLSWDVIKRFYKKAYFDLYYKAPAYIARRFWRGLRTGEIFWDAYFAVKFFFLLTSKSGPAEKENYAYESQWRCNDVRPGGIGPAVAYPKAAVSRWKREARMDEAAGIPDSVPVSR